MNATRDVAALAGRILLVAMFVISGWGKIGGFEGTAGYMASAGLPMAKVLLVLTIVLELAGGLAVVAGWKTRWWALALAGFTLLASFIFHGFWAVPPENMRIQQLMFMKNLSIAGGFLMLFAFGPGRLSLDRS